jgi:hypothetical protein
VGEFELALAEDLAELADFEGSEFLRHLDA